MVYLKLFCNFASQQYKPFVRIMYEVEKVLPFDENNTPKSTQIAQMFDEIAPQYDTLNHTMSMNLDKRWRRIGLRALSDLKPQTVLDVATGTGDLAIEAYRVLRPQKILGVDISENMMNVAKKKVLALGLQDIIDFDKQRCCSLTLESNSFDAITVAFGIRNFENLDLGLQQMLRVLRPGGRLLILELSTPENFPIKHGYKVYSKMIPLLGKLFANNKAAYGYLPKSISAFPQNREMSDIIRKNGFEDVSFRKLSFGICTMYLGNKGK